MFNALKAVMDEYEFQPSNIWNMDETNKDPHFSKVVAAKGRKNVVSINDSAQEQHVTVVGAISAALTAVQVAEAAAGVTPIPYLALLHALGWAIDAYAAETVRQIML